MTDQKFLFFDLGGVLIRFLFDFLVEKLARMFGVKPVEMVEFLENIWIPIEVGCGEKDIYDLFCNRFGKQVEIREFFDVFGLSVEAQDDCRRRPLFQKLRGAGVELGIISNVNVIHARHTEKRLSCVFEGVPRWRRFYSFEMCMRKDKTGQMFKAVCERCGVDPNQAVLVDDSPENIVGVSAVGGTGILFRGFHRTEYELIKHGILKKP